METEHTCQMIMQVGEPFAKFYMSQLDVTFSCDQCNFREKVTVNFDVSAKSLKRSLKAEVFNDILEKAYTKKILTKCPVYNRLIKS